MFSTVGFIVICIVFFISGICINVLQLMLLPLFWLNPGLYRKLINKLCYLIYAQITVLGEWWGHINLHVYASPKDLKVLQTYSTIVVLNHYSDVDWLVGWVVAERLGIISGSKAFGKAIMKYIPTFGWMGWFAEYAFVKRNWQDDQKHVTKILTGISQHKIPYSLSLFCEGTRRTSEKLKVSQDYAKENNMEPLKHHLLPRTKGFALTVHKLRKSANYICLLELGFPNLDESTIPHLIKRDVVQAHVHIRCIPMSDVPVTSLEETAEYCKKIYKEKDQLMDYFLTNGKFPGQTVSLERRKYNLVTFFVLTLFVTGLVSWWITMIAAVLTTVQLSVIIIASLLFFFGMYKLLLTLTQTHKGTSFGLNEDKRKEA